RALQRGCPSGSAERVALVELGYGVLPLRPKQPVALFLPGQVADVPADAVHGRKPSHRLFGGDAIDPAEKFATGEPELLHERMHHGDLPPIDLRRFSAWRNVNRRGWWYPCRVVAGPHSSRAGMRGIRSVGMSPLICRGKMPIRLRAFLDGRILGLGKL